MSTTLGLVDTLAQCLEAKAIDASPGYEIDGREVLQVTPADAAQAAAAIAACQRAGAMVIPVGSRGHCRGLSRSGDARPVVALSTGQLNRVVDYAVGDLTITVESGVVLAALDDLCAPQNQELAVCVPRRRTSTVGGLLAVNPCDPCRRRHGVMADALLEAEMVLADGAAIRVGARTVKNVAGYDLHKMMVGSRGALAMLTQVTLRLQPRPASQCVACTAAMDLDLALRSAAALLRGPTRPSCIEVLHGSLAERLRLPAAAQWMLLVGYADNKAAIDWQLQEAARGVPGGLEPLDEDASIGVLQAVADFATAPGIGFEIEILQQDVAATLRHCLDGGISAIADVAARSVRGVCPSDATAATLQALREVAGPQALLCFKDSPTPTTERATLVDSRAAGREAPADGQDLTYGPSTPQRRWMRALKKELDPGGVFPQPGFL